MPITGSMLYSLVGCPHRVTMDLYGDSAEQDETSAFVEMLWERGNVHEQSVMEGLEVEFLDLSAYSGAEKERCTLEAMENRESLIYSGRIRVGDLLGEPDLLRLDGDAYVPGDIKSGRGGEGDDKGAPKKLKKHYGVQLALYADVLERLGRSARRQGFVWDAEGKEVRYDLAAPMGPKTPDSLWDLYQQALELARAILDRSRQTDPAYAAACKLCHWYSACQRELLARDDLTLIPELGRTRRDAMRSRLPSIQALATATIEGLLIGKKTVFPGIGRGTLKKYFRRARLVHAEGRPYLLEPLSLPAYWRELFFDIEVDPMRDLCYLHGFVERTSSDNTTERYVAFFTDEPTPDAERKAFADAWEYIRKSEPCTIYYYSKYERTIWRSLREKYPKVMTENELESLFDPGKSFDLYFDVVRKYTEWPTKDHSIKTLAKYLGFDWRDTDPSGAASIEWFDSWVKSGDSATKERILEYNEDDCRATRVLLDGLRGLRTHRN